MRADSKSGRSEGEMNDLVPNGSRTLIVRVQTRVCALPLVHVIEMMRPLPLEPFAGAPSFVLGVSIVRGVPTPVVDLASVLGAPGGVPGRFVSLPPSATRRVALSVDAVLGVRDSRQPRRSKQLPPLFQEASKDVIEAMGTLDTQMLVVLAGRDGSCRTKCGRGLGNRGGIPMKGAVGSAEIEHFRSLVAQRIGLHFDDGKLDFLADVLRQRMRGYGLRVGFIRTTGASHFVHGMDLRK